MTTNTRPGTPLLAPMRAEARALRRGAGGRLLVLRTGTGPWRAARAAARLTGRTVAVVGIGGGLATQLRTGDVVVADQVRGEGRPVDVPGAELVAAALREARLTVHIGPVASVRRLVTGARREALAGTGALAADTESYWLVTGTVPMAVIRVVADGAGSALYSPTTLLRVRAALRALPAVAAMLADSVLLEGVR